MPLLLKIIECNKILDAQGMKLVPEGLARITLHQVFDNGFVLNLIALLYR